MAPSHQGRGAISRVASTLACIAIAAGTIFSAAACARPGKANLSTTNNRPTDPREAADPGEAADERRAAVPEMTTASPEEIPWVPTVDLVVDGTLSWAYLDRATGQRYASPNANVTSYTESMVKAWLAADELSRSEQYGRQPNRDLIVSMIRDSDDNAAEIIWLNNGADGSIARMIQTCQLTDTRIFSGWWSMTMMSAQDAVRLGACIADGVAAGPHWTEWLMDEMRQVRGEGRFGIVDGVEPTTAATLAIKNGWTLHYGDYRWRVNCLSIDTDWVLAVMLVYPGGHGLGYGANVCASVAKQVLAPVSEGAGPDPQFLEHEGLT
jgi:hypothetical protein